ncbi:MAG TPA: type II toxin-antitoxin system HipA family toxin [Lysobacter sp.]
MSLSVYVQGREVATLEALDSFTSRLIHREDVEAGDFVSLTMPVRREPWDWDDQLHPVFQMNLPEGYLLQVLQEQFGPHIGGGPMNLLAVIGRNMIGRVQVAPPGARLDEPAKAVDVEALLQGDNSAEAFADLVREHAASGVSGVVPKFLDTEESSLDLADHKKGTRFTHRHIIKGSSPHLPFVSLNEHLCMQVAAKVLPTAKTEVSRDGQALVVHRFDVDENGQRHWGMEDFCALLGLRPASKYDTTWERIVRAVYDHVPGTRRAQTLHQLATILLLTYALRNADCHAKNLALLYTNRGDVHLAPTYDMLTTAAYSQYAKQPPGIGLAGRKTWDPGRTLQQSIVKLFGVSARTQGQIVEQISTAIAEVGPAVRQAMEEYPAFHEIGKRMLLAWQEGLAGLRGKRTYDLGEADLGESFQRISDPEPAPAERAVIGRFGLADIDPMG